MAKSVIVPSDPAARKKIKNAIEEASASMVRIEAERDLIKEIIEVVKDEHQLPAKYVRKLINVYHKGSADKEFLENEDFTELYEAVTQ